MRNILIISILSLSIGLAVLVSSACGGFFCTNTPIDQSAERIIFTVNGDVTITAIVGINYTGNAEDFSWVVPVPSVPELDVAETASLDTLQINTEVQVILPGDPCGSLYHYGDFGGGGGDDMGMFVETGSVGPYDFAILGSEDATEMIRWLRDNNYVITEAMEPLVQLYVEEGMFFLAMKLSQESDVGDIQPVVMTYEAEHPTIPIRLTAVAAVEDLPIITWIFADSYYQPDNYANPPIDLSDAKGSNNVDSIGKNLASVFGQSVNPRQLYTDFQNRVQADYDGLAFITEYAQSTERLRTNDDPLLNSLAEQFTHVTRLRAQMSPEQMILDPVFIPASDSIKQSSLIRMSEHVDPLHFWGCGTDKGVDLEAVDSIFTTHTRIHDWLLDVAHPEDWVLSEIPMTHPDTPDFPFADRFYVFAPEPVTQDTVDAYFEGNDSTPPMLLMMKEIWQEVYEERGFSFRIENFLGLPDEDIGEGLFRLPPINGYEARVYRRYTPFLSAQYLGESLALAMLTSQADWDTNSEMYELMLDYATSFQYLLTSDHRHTLFLSRIGIFPYLDGWEYTTVGDNIYITPDGVGPDSNTQFRIMPVEQLAGLDGDIDINMRVEDNLKLIWELMAERYNLSDEHHERIVEGMATDPNAVYGVVPFTPDKVGLVGYVKLTRSGHILTIQGIQDEWDELEPLLLPMLTPPFPLNSINWIAFNQPR